MRRKQAGQKQKAVILEKHGDFLRDFRGDTVHPSTLNVMDERSPRRLTKRFLDAAERVGIPKINDYNGPEQDGAALAQVTQRNGRRWSTGTRAGPG